VLKNDNSWRAVAGIDISTDGARELAATTGSALAVDPENRHVSHVVADVLLAIRPCFDSAERYCKVKLLWHDAFTTLIPLLRELQVANIQKLFRDLRTSNVVDEWCRRAVAIIRDNHTSVTFYSHLLLHWNNCLSHASSLSPVVPLTPAHFGQDADESAWRCLRRWLTRLTTFNGGTSAATLASPSAIQLVQRSLMLFLLKWLRGVDLYNGADRSVVAPSPADFGSLLSLLARLRAFYLPESAVGQQQQVVGAVSAQPLVSQAMLDRFVLDQRALATDLERAVPACQDLMPVLREKFPCKKRARFDAERDSIALRLQSALMYTVDNTK
jgi:hypothetical protein